MNRNCGTECSAQSLVGGCHNLMHKHLASSGNIHRDGYWSILLLTVDPKSAQKVWRMFLNQSGCSSGDVLILLRQVNSTQVLTKTESKAQAPFLIHSTPTPGSPGSSLCHTPSPGLEHPWRMRPGSRAGIASRAGCHQFHQLEKEVQHSA